MFPSECAVHLNVKRRGRNPLLSAHNVAYFHKMVVNDIRKVIRRKSVAPKKDRIRTYVFVFPFNVAKKMVVEFGYSFHRNFKADNVRFSGIKICLYFFRRKVAAVTVITRSHFIFCLNFSYAFKTFGIAETVICFSLFHKFESIFFVQFKTFALNVRTVFSAFIAAFVPFKTKPCHRVVKILHVFFIVAGAVCVFQTKNEFSAFRACIKIIKKCCAYTADMLHTGRGRCVSYADFFIFSHKNLDIKKTITPIIAEMQIILN